MSKLDLLSLFKHVPSPERDEFESLLQTRTYEKNSHLMKYGEVGDEMMFVVSGQVKVSLINDEGKEFVVTRLGPGEMLGELALITNETRTADVIAMEDTIVLVLAKADFVSHGSKYNGVTFALLKALARRVSYSTQKSGELALLDVYHRLARVLIEMSETQEDETQVINSRPTHQELASMVGTSREVVSRALKNMEQEGSIEIEGKSIIIRDLPQ